MKKLITFISALLVLAATVYAVDVKLGWDMNPSTDMVDKYVIYQANTTNGVFTPVVTVVNTNVGTVKGLTPGFYRFVIVAHNAIGNATPSNEVSVPTNGPSATKNLIVLEVK